jgi:N-acetyl-anhydromuramyl-L-alanine amidase AmpD
MSTIEELPYVHAGGDPGVRPRTQVVVIHATDNTASDEAEAAYAAHRSDKTSAHFYNDADSVIRALPLDHIANGCREHGNAISIQFELCGLSDHLADAVLRRVAPVVAEVCRRFNIPVGHVGPAAVRGGQRGICGHDVITAAFPEDHGTHTDPGLHFPWDAFLGYVQAAAGIVTVPTDYHPQVPIAEPRFAGRTLRLTLPRMSGQDVRTWQARMSVRGWVITVDGVYGPQSAEVCQRFQKEKKLHVDGLVGPDTWHASWQSPIT